MRLFQKFQWHRTHDPALYLVTIERYPNANGTVHEVIRLNYQSGNPDEYVSALCLNENMKADGDDIHDFITEYERREIMLLAAQLWEEFWTSEFDIVNSPRQWVAWHDQKWVNDVMDS
jgi:hypothetical protein